MHYSGTRMRSYGFGNGKQERLSLMPNTRSVNYPLVKMVSRELRPGNHHNKNLFNNEKIVLK